MHAMKWKFLYIGTLPACLRLLPCRVYILNLNMQLKIYASKREISASIPNDYDAKGESLSTLLAFHNEETALRGSFLSEYTLSVQIIYPILVGVFAWFLMYSQFGIKSLALIRAEADNPIPVNQQEPHRPKNSNAEHSQQNFRIHMTIICCFCSLAYVLFLDIVAVVHRHSVNKLIFYNPSIQNRIYDSTPLQIEYSIPIVILVQDLIVVSVMILILFVGSAAEIRGWKWFTWYYVLFGPAMCIVIHSYHILIGFIHTPQHATSILIFYGIVVLFYMVTLRTFYYFFSKCCVQIIKDTKKKNKDTKKKDKDTNECANLKECTQNGCCKHVCHQHTCKFLILFAIASVLPLFIAYLAFLFILVPINNAIDDAPSQIVAINQTILIIIGILITFKIFKDKKDSFLDYLVKAEKNRIYAEANNGSKANNEPSETESKAAVSAEKEKWEKKSQNEKREYVADIILEHFKPQKSMDHGSSCD